MDECQIATADYQTLAEHLPRGRSLRELAAELRCSHETVRARCARESADLIAEVEADLRAGRVPLFEVPPQPLARWQEALTLCQFLVDRLRERGWPVRARGVRLKGGDGIAFVVEIAEEEQ